jgi:hypothetical protein
LIFAVPYFSTIRNPVKFLDPFSFGLVILFAFGIDALQRKYMPETGPAVVSRWAGLGNWWKKATRFEKYWVYGTALFGIFAVIGRLIYASQRGNIQQYMQSTQVTEDLDGVFSFSLHRIDLFLIFFVLTAGLAVLILSGAFTGKMAKTGGVLLGLLMVADLGLANQPWILYWDYVQKYESNSIVDILRDKPYEHRVSIVPITFPSNEQVFSKLYQIEWLQQLFPFYNIQSFDTADLPRTPEDLSAFKKVYQKEDTNTPYFNISRAWKLTNTRYILSPIGFSLFWNGQSYLAGSQLQIVSRFEIVPKPGVSKIGSYSQLTAYPTPSGSYALFEITNTLPRAKLYTQWQVNTNNKAALEQVYNPNFDLDQTVLVDSGMPPGSATGTTNSNAGTVEYVSYAPKNVVLKADASAPSVLLLNDHFDPNWKVLVDGAPAQLLRCNFFMRGVYLEPGSHSVQFRFQPQVRLLYVSLAAIVFGLLMLGILLVSSRTNVSPPPTPAVLPVQKPAPKLETASRKKPGAVRNGKIGVSTGSAKT